MILYNWFLFPTLFDIGFFRLWWLFYHILDLPWKRFFQMKLYAFMICESWNPLVNLFTTATFYHYFFFLSSIYHLFYGNNFILFFSKTFSFLGHTGTWDLLLLTWLLLPSAIWVHSINMRRGNSLHNWSTCCSSMRNLRLMIMLGLNWQMMRCCSLIMTASNLFNCLHSRRSPRSMSQQAFINALNWKCRCLWC